MILLPLVFFKIKDRQTTEINSKVGNYKNCTFVTCATFKTKIIELSGLGKGNNRQLRMKVRTYVNKRLVADKKKKKNILLRAIAMKEIPTFGNLQNRKYTTEINSKVVYNYEKYSFVTHVPCKNKKILEFGGFGKEINRQLGIKVQTYMLINVW